LYAWSSGKNFVMHGRAEQISVKPERQAYERNGGRTAGQHDPYARALETIAISRPGFCCRRTRLRHTFAPFRKYVYTEMDKPSYI
jgi:hypothetical protein